MKTSMQRTKMEDQNEGGGEDMKAGTKRKYICELLHLSIYYSIYATTVSSTGNNNLYHLYCAE